MSTAAIAAAAAAAAGTVALIACWHASRVCVPFSHPERRRAAAHKQVFVLAVNLRFTAPEDKQAFLEVWAPLAEFVRVHEPATLSFELLQSDKDDCHVLVYERYLDRAAYLAHRESGAFKHFKAMQAALPFKVAVAGDSFHEQNLGFML